MRDDPRFALVLRTGIRGIAADCPFDYGICFVEGETARTAFVDLEGLERALGDYPCVPSIYGKCPGIVSFEAEMEAVDVLTTAATEFSDKYQSRLPSSYERLRERVAGGLVITLSDGRIGFEVAQWVTDALSWQVGDRIDMAVGPDGKSFRIFADRDGTALVIGRPGWLTAIRDWPFSSANSQDCVTPVPVSVAEGCIMFDYLPEPESPGNPVGCDPQPPLSPKRPIDYRWGLLALAAAYGIVATALKLF